MLVHINEITELAQRISFYNHNKSQILNILAIDFSMYMLYNISESAIFIWRDDNER